MSPQSFPSEMQVLRTTPIPPDPESKPLPITLVTASISNLTRYPTSVLVKIHSVALNPTDWKVPLYYHPPPNLTIGHDFSGTIVSVGADVSKDWKVGDQVAGAVHGCNPSDPQEGAFAEYVVARESSLIRVPEGKEWGLEGAATLMVGLGTVALGMGLELGLP